jgi:hypothetical protein
MGYYRLNGQGLVPIGIEISLFIMPTPSVGPNQLLIQSGKGSQNMKLTACLDLGPSFASDSSFISLWLGTWAQIFYL